MITVESKERNDGGKPMTFTENNSVEMPEDFYRNDNGGTPIPTP